MDRGSVRDRLLAAADELFYEEGVHTVGIDRVIERAGVAKASLYSAFGSKDELIRCYLNERHAATRARVLAALDRYDDPQERMLGLFDYLAERLSEPDYRGCAFINASAESPRGGVVEAVSDESRGWLRGVLVDLAEQAGAVDPQRLAAQLALLYDGAVVTGRMDRDPSAADSARAAAGAVLSVEIPG
jgi:AcrR family transcriptional regulator